jgi:hypothetical protein
MFIITGILYLYDGTYELCIETISISTRISSWECYICEYLTLSVEESKRSYIFEIFIISEIYRETRVSSPDDE